MKIILFLAADLIVVALVWIVAVSRHDTPAAPERLAAAAVAARPLGSGAVLAEADVAVELKRVARDGTVITDPKTIVGWRLTSDVERGVILSDAMIAPNAPFDAPNPRCAVLTLPVAVDYRAALPRRGEIARAWLLEEKVNPVVAYARVLGVSSADAANPYVQLEVLPATLDRVAALAKEGARYWVTAAPAPAPPAAAPARGRAAAAGRRAPAPAPAPCERPTAPAAAGGLVR